MFVAYAGEVVKIGFLTQNGKLQKKVYSFALCASQTHDWQNEGRDYGST